MRAALVALLLAALVAALPAFSLADGSKAGTPPKKCTKREKWSEEDCAVQYWECIKAGNKPHKRTCHDGMAFHPRQRKCVPYPDWGACYVMYRGSRLVTNMALAGSTGTSSFPLGSATYYANDNNTAGIGPPDIAPPPSAGVPANTRVSFTKVESNPYWYTTLMPGLTGTYPPQVGYVRIFAAQGKWGARMPLSNLEVRVGTDWVQTGLKPGGRITSNALCATMPGRMPSNPKKGAQNVVTLKCNATGTILSVQIVQQQKAALALAEVQVFDGPPPPL